VIREASYAAQCADCGGRIDVGAVMEYLPPTGDRPALTTHHPECPERKRAKRGANHGQRDDPEETGIVWRACDGCGQQWTVRRTSLAAKQRAFVGHCCDGRFGYRACDPPHEGERHLKVAV
jgi:hypothetical protein